MLKLSSPDSPPNNAGGVAPDWYVSGAQATGASHDAHASI